MQTIYHKTARRWLPSLCFWLAMAIPAAPAAEQPEIVLPLDERLLAHLETTAQHLAPKVKADSALRKDFRACNGDKKIEGNTPDTISASIAVRHPRLTTALAAEDWKPGDFYVTFATFAQVPLASELSRGGIPDTNATAHRNIAFFDRHKARVLAMVEKVNAVLGATSARD